MVNFRSNISLSKSTKDLTTFTIAQQPHRMTNRQIIYEVIKFVEFTMHLHKFLNVIM